MFRINNENEFIENPIYTNCEPLKKNRIKSTIYNWTHGSFLFHLNILLIVVTIVLSTVSVGYVFRNTWTHSPILMLLGHVVSFILLIIAEIGCAVYWALAGIDYPFKQISDLLPSGTQTIRASVCFFPISLLILVLLVKVYCKANISKEWVIRIGIVCVLVSCISIIFLFKYWR